jgi:hypothetical protein
MDPGSIQIITLYGGVLTIDNFCADGRVDVYGDCALVDNSFGPGVTVNDYRIPGHS